MSKQMAKHHKKSAGHHRAVRHTKRAHGQKLMHPKKSVTQEEGSVGIAAVEQQNLGEDEGDRLDEVFNRGSEDAADVVEVLEVELVGWR